MFDRNPSLVERIDDLIRQYEGDAVADVLMETKRRIKRAEDCLLGFTPSGSEYFNRDGDGFRLDVDTCERVIRENYNRGHRAMIEVSRLRKLCSDAAALYSQGGTYPINGEMAQRLAEVTQRLPAAPPK